MKNKTLKVDNVTEQLLKIYEDRLKCSGQAWIIAPADYTTGLSDLSNVLTSEGILTAQQNNHLQVALFKLYCKMNDCKKATAPTG